MLQNPSPRGPNTFQNPFWRPPEKPSWKENVFEGLEDASRTRFGRPFGSPKSFQTRSGSASDTHLISKSVLEWFWAVLDTNFGVFFKSSWAKMRSKNDYSDETRIFKNTCVFPVRLHLHNVDKGRTKLVRTLFFSICQGYTWESVSRPPLGLDLGAIWAAKID